MKIFTIVLLIIISGHSASAQEQIAFEAFNVYPEGVAYDAKADVFYVSSVKTGTISSVSQGKYTMFHQDKSFKSSFGMKIDSRQGKLWVCVADPNYSMYRDASTFKKMSRVIALDLASGKKQLDIDVAALIPGRHFANDLTLDGKGNVYVTDSFAGAIYKIDSKGKASIFSQHPLFKGLDIGLNGIVYHPDGFLLTANSTRGSILKISVANPTQVAIVKIDQFFPGADGLWLDEQKNLFLVQNKGVNKVFRIRSTDKFLSARVDAATPSDQLFKNVTTATQKNNNLYAIDSRMNELSDSTILKPADTFTIQPLKFISPQP
jgi:sugar lactone lactonase YvrE